MAAKIKYLLVIFFALMQFNQAAAWGFWAHQRINRMAVFTLPPEMLVLYKAQLEYLTVHAVDPDKRRYAVDGEAARHYIDIDHYGSLPFDNVPRYWEAAVDSFSEDTLQAYGIVPWHLPEQIKQLTRAFEAGDLQRILKLSADLGHYVGDSHVPLHTTKNYNGQMSGQKGIHGFWESRLPELFAEGYNFYVGQAYYYEDILLEGWDAVLESHTALDSVLRFEAELNDSFPSDKKYGFESRNNIVIRTYSREYSDAYHEMLGGMVERRMRRSILRTGSAWYTAWRNAGSPNLGKLLKVKVKEERKKYKRKLKIIDRESQEVGELQAPAPNSMGFRHPVDCRFYRDTYATWRGKKRADRKAAKYAARQQLKQPRLHTHIWNWIRSAFVS